MDLLSPEDARAVLEKKGITPLPSVKTLKQAGFAKVFSGKMADGSIWKIRKETEDGCVVWIEQAA